VICGGDSAHYTLKHSGPIQGPFAAVAPAAISIAQLPSMLPPAATRVAVIEVVTKAVKFMIMAAHVRSNTVGMPVDVADVGNIRPHAGVPASVREKNPTVGLLAPVPQNVTENESKGNLRV
jgi:hypothetical protein